MVVSKALGGGTAGNLVGGIAGVAAYSGISVNAQSAGESQIDNASRSGSAVNPTPTASPSMANTDGFLGPGPAGGAPEAAPAPSGGMLSEPLQNTQVTPVPVEGAATQPNGFEKFLSGEKVWEIGAGALGGAAQGYAARKAQEDKFADEEKVRRDARARWDNFDYKTIPKFSGGGMLSRN